MPQTVPTTTSIRSWNSSTKQVEVAIRTGRMVTPETSLIFAGAPRLSDVGGISNRGNLLESGGAVTGRPLATTGRDAFYPIGLIEQFQLQQVQNVSKLFSIGARRSYQVAGRVNVAGNLGRTLFNGPNLLRVLFAYYPNVIQLANGDQLGGENGVIDSVMRNIVGAGDQADEIWPEIDFAPGALAGVDPESSDPHAFFINLMSDLFKQPFGLGVIMMDNRKRTYGGFYCEDCMITNHNINWNSAGALVTEALGFQCDAAIPMQFGAGILDALTAG